MGTMDNVIRPILLIERGSTYTFSDDLIRKGYEVHLVDSGKSALTHVKKNDPTLVILNAASMGTSGLRICQRIGNALEGIPLIHIMPEGTSDEESKHEYAHVVLVMPFTSRKLINRIKRLMPPEGDNKAVKFGAFELYPVTHVVRANGNEKRLTPKAAALLEIFINHPDEILERSYLMRQVWETDYIGDTRTLDVHIRWLREAVEEDASHPKHLITVRGRGYTFHPELGTKSDKKKGT